MNIKNYRKRLIDKKLSFYLESCGAVLLEGPKWCGKTWTARNAAKSEFLLANSYSSFNNKNLALMNPALALEGENPRLLDEWQEVPALWDAVRCSVDEKDKKGLFILTGSASINKNSYIHTGTGRIARLRMRPMSLYESGKSDGKISLLHICLGKAKDCLTGDVDLNVLIEYILTGGWPSTIDFDFPHAVLVSREYVKSIINEDIYKVDNVRRDKLKIELLLKSLARNESTTATIATLKKDITKTDLDNVNVDTISNYLNLFNSLYITENIPPFASNARSSIRIKQSEKRHFVDPSLPCALLSLTKEKLLNDFELLGFLFESLVERDLLTYADSINANLFHYQDYKNNEIDAVIELENGDWCAFEIKLGANKIDEAASKLIAINEDIKNSGGEPAKALCVICGLTNAAYYRPDGVYVAPITSLKD